jgi:hypothetical protein
MRAAPAIAIVLTTLAVGCQARFERTMTTQVNQFVGEDIHAAIAKLGYPSRQESIAGERIYRWATDGSATPVTAAAQVESTQVTQLACAIDLVVDASNVVIRGTWAGARDACSAMQDRLEGKEPPARVTYRDKFEASCRAQGKVARYTPAGDVTYVQECIARDAPEKPGSITVP